MKQPLLVLTFLGFLLGCFAIDLTNKELSQICNIHYQSTVDTVPAQNLTDFLNDISELKGVATSEVTSDRNIAALFRVLSLYTNNVNFKLSSFWSRPPLAEGASSSTTPAPTSAPTSRPVPAATETTHEKESTQSEFIPGITGIFNKFKEFFSFGKSRPGRALPTLDSLRGSKAKIGKGMFGKLGQLAHALAHEQMDNQNQNVHRIAESQGKSSRLNVLRQKPWEKKDKGHQEENGLPPIDLPGSPLQHRGPVERSFQRQAGDHEPSKPSLLSTLFGITPGTSLSAPSIQAGKVINETVKQTSATPKDSNMGIEKSKKYPKGSFGGQIKPSRRGQDGMSIGLRDRRSNVDEAKPFKKSDIMPAKGSSKKVGMEKNHNGKHGAHGKKKNDQLHKNNNKPRGKLNHDGVMRKDRDHSDFRGKGKGKAGKGKGKRSERLEDIIAPALGQRAKTKGKFGAGKVKGKREARREDVIHESLGDFDFPGKPLKGKVGAGKGKGRREVQLESSQPLDQRSKGTKGKVGKSKVKGMRTAHHEGIDGQAFDQRKGKRGKVGAKKGKGRSEVHHDDISGAIPKLDERSNKHSSHKNGRVGADLSRGKRQSNVNICSQIKFPKYVDSKHDENFRDFLIDLAKQSVEIRGDIKLD